MAPTGWQYSATVPLRTPRTGYQGDIRVGRGDMTATDGQLIAGRYALHTILGHGGAGVVWRGIDTTLDRPVAVKVFRTHLAVAGDQDGAVDRDRILREARLAARLQHPGAVGVYDVVEHDDRLHLVMEFVDAPDLAAHVADEGPLTPAAVARLGLQLLDVLEAGHRIGVVHRDVKPSNVLLGDDGRVRLTDFGTAILAGEDRLTATDVVIGSPAYMAPEQATSRDVGPAADLWSLGATLHHAVQGAPPFSGPSALATMHAVLHDDPVPAPRAGLLATVLDGLLVRDPAERLDGPSLRQALEAVAGEGSLAAPDPTGHADTAVLDSADVPASRDGRPEEEEGHADEQATGRAVGAARGFEAPMRRTSRSSRRPVGVVVLTALLLAAAGGLAVAVSGGQDDTVAQVGVQRASDDQEASADPASEPTGVNSTVDATVEDSVAPGSAPESTADASLDEGAGVTDQPPSESEAVSERGQGRGQTEGQTGARGAGQGQGSGQDQGQAENGAATAPDPVAATPDVGAAQPATQGVPADWVTYAPDDAPYRVSRPPSWTANRLDRTRTDLRDPASSAYLRLDWTDDPAPDPLADWQAYEPAFSDGKDSYERIRMEPTTFDGQPAALWEYRYSQGGEMFHAYNLNVSGQEYGYALNYQTRESEWATAEPRFASFTASYDIVG